jgi:hypothetical protein
LSAELPAELHFLLDASGALIVFQQRDASWAGVLAFSSEERAREFLERSRLDARDIAAIATGDRAGIAQLIAMVKRRAVRNLLLDLDYATGKCMRVEFEGDGLGAAVAHQFSPQPSAHR